MLLRVRIQGASRFPRRNRRVEARRHEHLELCDASLADFLHTRDCQKCRGAEPSALEHVTGVVPQGPRMSDEREVLLNALLDGFANDEPLRSIHEVEQYIS